MSRTFRLGLFIVSTLTILAIGVFLIGDRQLLFSSTYKVTTTFKNVAGLGTGAEVRIGGVHEGAVKRIQLPTRADGGMVVVMALKRSTDHVVRTDSIASIQTEGLLGNKYVEISFGSENAPKVENGGSIASVPPLDISDLMKKTDEILDTTRQTMGHVQESAEHFKAISSKIDQGQGTVGALVNDKKVYAQLNAMTAEARTGAAAFRENMEALRHNFLLRGFFSRRGFEDSTKLTQHAIAELPKTPAFKTFTYDARGLFADADTAKLKKAQALSDAGRFLESNPFGAAVVSVSGGMTGNADEVELLTQARAMVVRDYLVKTFKMDDTRVKTMGLGKRETANDGGTVEIRIYPPGSAAGPTKIARTR